MVGREEGGRREGGDRVYGQMWVRIARAAEPRGKAITFFAHARKAMIRLAHDQKANGCSTNGLNYRIGLTSHFAKML